jgi:hypothetical protein
MTLAMAIAGTQRPNDFLDIPNRSELSKEVEELFRSNVVAMTGQRQMI